MSRRQRGGPVFIGEIAEEFMADLWERMRVYRAARGLPMPHISEVVHKQREETR